MQYPQFPPRVPLFWREDGQLQCGLSPAVALAAPRRTDMALRLLDGDVSPHTVARQLQVPLTDLEAALQAAYSVAPRPRPHTSVTIVGMGALADVVERSVAPRRVHRLTSEREAFPTSHVIHAVGAAALSAEVVAHALAARITLLPICIRQDGIDVGPLVIPEEVGCPLCVECAAIDVSPEWSTASHQLPRHSLTASAGEMHFAAGLICAALEGLEDGHRTDLHRTRWGLTAGRLQRLRVSPHPLCVCARQRWSAPHGTNRLTRDRRPQARETATAPT